MLPEKARLQAEAEAAEDARRQAEADRRQIQKRDHPGQWRPANPRRRPLGQRRRAVRAEGGLISAPPRLEPRLLISPEGKFAGIVLPGEDGYDEADPPEYVLGGR